MAKASIETRLEALVQDFARDVMSIFTETINALVGTNSVSRATITRASKARAAASGPRGRRSATETEALAKKVADFLKGQPKGARVDAIGRALKMTTAKLALPIKKALASRAILKRGQKRATVYLAAR